MNSDIRRIIIAVVLMAVILVLTPILFPTAVYNTADGNKAADSAALALSAVDSAVAADRTNIPQPAGATETPPTAAGAAPQTGMSAIGVTDTATDEIADAAGDAPASSVVVIDTTQVETTPAIFRTTNQGAALIGVEMRNFRILENGGRSQGAPVELAQPGDRLLGWRLVVPGDTVRFDRIAFNTTEVTEGDTRIVRYDATVANRAVSIAYSFLPDSYLVNIEARVSGEASNAFLLVDMPPGFRSSESDTTEDRNHLAYAYKVEGNNAKGITFKSLDPGERRIEPGPLTWVAAKNKYFIVGLISPPGEPRFAELDAVGAVRVTKQATRALATVVIPVNTNGTNLQLYTGPQEYKRLIALGQEFETSNPYGGWLQGIVQPFAAATIKLLIWMKATLSISYGWILIIFGIAIRLILWPLNQRFMRSSLQMQRIQPELQEVQKKYKGDPQRMQAELMKIYKAHDASPFSSLSGCLVMLIPFPVFIALFFVFQNTIEFRGVPFLWYPDISVKDPYYITPVLVAITSLLMAWMGMRGVKAGDQQKIMMYAMPAVMLFVFINLASGLNLYYLVQNIASLPQQWIIARERRTATPVVSTPAAASLPKGKGKG